MQITMIAVMMVRVIIIIMFTLCQKHFLRFYMDYLILTKYFYEVRYCYLHFEDEENETTEK